ncbi:hypothetical protein PsorP6_015405 [Peronosclerospora sorghi]|uniref:Uncharacterized protein n=1 Tax=Peronosclerospora sorghi TaxID=230839 RepID=A0ACC0WNA7_9STRA|nr:hypothetical protein PsorP6_015405 [Peronosclerospora sorghi]
MDVYTVKKGSRRSRGRGFVRFYRLARLENTSTLSLREPFGPHKSVRMNDRASSEDCNQDCVTGLPSILDRRICKNRALFGTSSPLATDGKTKG